MREQTLSRTIGCDFCNLSKLGEGADDRPALVVRARPLAAV
jgi:hypothetical protein